MVALKALPLHLFQVTASFLAVILAGYLLKNLKVLKQEDSQPINQLVLYLTLPALVFSVFVKARLSVDLLMMSLLALMVIGSLLVLTFLLGNAFKFEPALLGGWIIAAAIGNTAYLGYPVVSAVFGSSKLINAVFFDYVVGIVIFSIGVYISKKYGDKSEEGFGFIELFKFPALLAVFPALIFHYIKMPLFLLNVIEQIGKATAPLVLISIGLNLKKMELKKYYRPLFLLLVIKLVLSPVLAFLFAGILRLNKDMLAVGFVQSAMPPAMMSVVLGNKYGLDIDFLVKAVILGTFLSMISIPLISFLLIK